MPEENSVLKNGGRLLGETLITPGTSLLVDGQIKSGLLHVGAGLIARFTLGLPGLVLVAANSYSKTVTGDSLMTHLGGSTTSHVEPDTGSSDQNSVVEGEFEEVDPSEDTKPTARKATRSKTSPTSK